MNRRLLIGLAALMLCRLTLADDPLDKDVSWKAKQEISRRGAHVEYVNGIEASGPEAVIAEMLAPPADDSSKWVFTLVTMKGCKFCDQLRGDFDTAPVLQAWVNSKDYKKSWAHFQIVQIEDKSQDWRWVNYRPKSFPTLIVQPPFDRSWGDPHTIVFLKEGYDGKPDKLAASIRSAMDKYGKAIYPQRTAWKDGRDATLALAGGGMEQTAGGWTPPVTPPAPLGPTPQPQTFPPSTPEVPPVLTLAQVQAASPDADAQFWIEELAKNYVDAQKVSMDWLLKKMTPTVKPAVTPAVTPAPTPSGGFLWTILPLVLGLLGGGSLTGLIVFALQTFRNFRKAAGQTLLIPNDASFQELMDLLKGLGHVPVPVPPTTVGAAIRR